MSETYDLTLNIRRYDPEGKSSAIKQYHVKAGGVLRFVDVFRNINEELDPTLTWPSSCEHGMCGSCGMIINGKPLLACELLVKNAVELFKTTTFVIRPLTIAPVLRDLTVDLESAYDRIRVVKPYLIKAAPPHPEGDEYRVSPDLLKIYESATRCINCFCCATACVSPHTRFLGPNAMMAQFVRLMDPREEAKDERIEILRVSSGLARCHTSRACSHVCPKEIDVAHFIALAKEGNFTSKA